MTGPWAALIDRIGAVGGHIGVLSGIDAVSSAVALVGTRGPGSTILIADPLPHDPGRPSDARATRAIAMAGLRRALDARGSIPAERAFGLAALPGGPDKFHFALQTTRATVGRTLHWPTGADSVWQVRVAIVAVIGLIAKALGIEEPVATGFEGSVLATREIAVDADALRHPGIADLLAGRRDRVGFHLRGEGRFEAVDDGDEAPAVILAGSFRPFHAGHAAMAEAAAQWAGRPCWFDLSLFHPEKPPLDYVAIASRLRGFGEAVGRLCLTNAPTYVEKARVHPGATFAVGHDTALRILDARFYGGIEGRDAMLAELEALGTRFLVFGRVDDASGRFRDAIDHPEVAEFLARRATFVPEAEFRVDLSSTAIRARVGEDMD